MQTTANGAALFGGIFFLAAQPTNIAYRRKKGPDLAVKPSKYWWDVRGSNPRQTD